MVVQAAFDTVDETLSPYAVELSNGDVVDAEDSFCAARFANHSSNPEHINFLLVEGATMRSGDGRLGHVLRHTVRAAQRRVLTLGPRPLPTLGPRPLPTVLFGSEAATRLRRRHVGSTGQRPRPCSIPAGLLAAAADRPCC
eukprot:COSAG01_NODE_38019_length_495_cov_1.747475_1_plen_140_part_10